MLRRKLESKKEEFNHGSLSVIQVFPIILRLQPTSSCI